MDWHPQGLPQNRTYPSDTRKRSGLNAKRARAAAIRCGAMSLTFIQGPEPTRGVDEYRGTCASHRCFRKSASGAAGATRYDRCGRRPLEPPSAMTLTDSGVGDNRCGNRSRHHMHTNCGTAMSLWRRLFQLRLRQCRRRHPPVHGRGIGNRRGRDDTLVAPWLARP